MLNRFSSHFLCYRSLWKNAYSSLIWLFSPFLFYKKDQRQFSFSRKQMHQLSTSLIQKGDLILLLCHKVDQNEECTESHNSLKSTENEKNSFLIDFVTTALEKPKESQVTVGDVEEEKEKAELIMNGDLTAEDAPPLQLQSILGTESSQVFI